MINPSEINLFSLPWVLSDATAGLAAQPGIYFAIDSLNCKAIEINVAAI